MSPVPSNDNKTPSSLTPTQATYWVMARQALLILAGTSLGGKFLTPEVMSYLTDNWTLIGTLGAGAISLGIGLYRSLRGPTITSTSKLDGAVVVLDSQAEANTHPGSGVVGPSDPLPAKAA